MRRTTKNKKLNMKKGLLKVGKGKLVTWNQLRIRK